MKGLLYILTFLFLGSCGTSSKIPADVIWEITKENSNESANTSNININLNKPIDEATLKIIAEELRETRKQYDKLWIFYYLPNTSDDKVWATTYFNPEFSVDIMGAKKAAIGESPKLVNVEGEMLGKWRSEVSMPGAILALTKDDDGQLHVLVSVTGEIKMDSKVNETTDDGRRRFQDVNSHGEYFIIETNGNLGMYNSNGKFDEATIIK